jgi:hypothetical protein
MKVQRFLALSLFLTVLPSITIAENLPGFPRDQFGSVVLKDNQNFSPDTSLELSIGDYQNEPILNYSEDSIFARLGKPVGRLDVLTDVQTIPCTAFIVTDRHIMTNYHCSTGLLDIPKLQATRIDAMTFIIGYLQTGVVEGVKKFTVIPTPIEANKQLDYAIHEVIGNPSKEYGILRLSNRVPKKGDPFWIIGHPMGEAQRISREQCRASNPAVSEERVLHTCDTLPGNSGSPVIDATSRMVVALHHAGSRKDDVNFGILMKEILDQSATVVASLETNQTNGVSSTSLDSCGVLYSAAESAKECYAYKAYLKECGTHVLAPIARSYNLEFCSGTELPLSEQKPTDVPNSQSDDMTAFELAKTADDFAQFISEYPSSTLIGRAFNQLGLSLNRQGETKLAARAFLNGYMQDKVNPIADQLLYNLGNTLLKLNQMASACELLKRVPIEHPGSSGAAAANETYGRSCG